MESINQSVRPSSLLMISRFIAVIVVAASSVALVSLLYSSLLILSAIVNPLLLRLEQRLLSAVVAATATAVAVANFITPLLHSSAVDCVDADGGCGGGE